MKRTVVVACVAWALGGLVAAAPAGAAVTTSTVTVSSPAGTYLIADEVTPDDTLTLTGTSDGNGSDTVDIRCYYGAASKLLRAGVPVMSDGTFSFSGSLAPIDDTTCVLRAAPHGDGSAHPPGTVSSFAGPTLAVGDRAETRVSSGPNAGALERYHLYAAQLAGAFDYGSLGDCAIAHSYVLDPVTLAQPPPLDHCDAGFGWRNGDTAAGFSPPTRSELQVDGADAYLPGNIGSIAGFTATDNAGFPSLTYGYSIDPATGDLALDETDQVVRCSPGGAFPPSSSGCSSFVGTGVQIRLHVVQSADGRAATATQWLSSTDGHAHQVDLLEDNQFHFPNHDGEYDFPWAGGGMAPYTTPGQAIGGPAAAPGSLYVDGSATAPDGSESAPRGAVTFASAPDSVTNVAATNNGSGFGWLQLGYRRTVPATGTLALGFAYADAFAAAEVAADTARAEAAFRPSVAIGAPPGGTRTAQSRVTVTGSASDANGLASLTVNGIGVPVAADGSWSVSVPLSAGANAITAVATNVFGNSAQASTSATFAPPLPAPIITRLIPTGPAIALAAGAGLKLICQAPPGAVCAGRDQLTTLEVLQSRTIRALSSRARPRTRRVLLGTSTFLLRPGQTATLTVPLNPLGRRLLARFRRLPATMNVLLTSTSPPAKLTAHVTLLARAKKKKSAPRALGHPPT